MFFNRLLDRLCYPAEMREKRIEKLTEELFGDESNILGRTVTGEAIVVPQSYETTQKES